MTIPERLNQIEHALIHEPMDADRLEAERTKLCWCHSCRDNRITRPIMVVCPDCGNKRCPKASHHAHGCTRSNASGQAGSVFGGWKVEDGPLHSDVAIGGRLICPVPLEVLWAIKERIDEIRLDCVANCAFEPAAKCLLARKAIDDAVRAGGELREKAVRIEAKEGGK